jgi:hypothetical protein
MAMKWLLVFLSVVSWFSFAQNNCPVLDKQQLGIEYVSAKGNSEDKRQVHWRVWRTPGKLAYEYPEKGIVEIWQLTPQNKVEFMRLFTHEQRGIYYQNEDLKAVNMLKQWQDLNQLVPVSSRVRFTKTNIAQTGTSKPGLSQDACFTYQDYYSAESKQHLVWINELDLPKTILFPGQQVNIQFKRFHSAVESHAFFAQLAHYDLLDFADIGDSESDPFIRNMITLGYSQHANPANYPGAGHAH